MNTGLSFKYNLKKSGIKVTYRSKDGAIIPYICINNLNIKLPIKEVGIGPKNNIDIAKIGLDHFLKNNIINNCFVWKSEATMRY